MPQALLDIKGAADHFGTTPRHIRSLISTRRLAFYKVGHYVRFSTADLDAWLAENRVDAVAP